MMTGPEHEPMALDDDRLDDGASSSGPPHVRVDDGSWRDLLVTKTVRRGDTEAQVVAPNVSNAVTILRYHPRWRGVLAWDAFGERITLRRPAPWHPAVAPSAAEAGVLRETDIVRIIDWLVRTEGLAFGAKTIEQAVPVVAEACSYHPVRQYLERLEWDGAERLPTWLSVYCGVEQSPYSAAVGTRWMVSAVARPMEPGCQVDCMLILEGPQGVGKSSAFRALVPEPAFYSETGINIGDKDSYQALHGVWIYLIDELDSLKRAEITRTKNFITSVKDHFRPSYGRVARDFYRQNLFAGTTNEALYLIDRANRRYWPTKVVRPMAVAALARDRDQLWAEAFARYGNGERWYADTPELRRLCEAEQAERVHSDPWEETIARWLADPRVRAEGDTLRATGQPYPLPNGPTTGEVLAHAIGKPDERITRPDVMRVADVLRSLGYERGPKRTEANGSRVRRYAPEVGQVVQPSGAARDTENTPVDTASAPPAPPAPPSTRTRGDDGGAVEKTQDAFSGGAGGADGPVLFLNDLADLGVRGTR